MSSVKTNILANFVGKGVGAVMGLVFIPIYVRYLGIESYGLVGVFALLSALSGFLDLGVTPTINRELARLSTRPDAAPEARDLVRTLEVIYWGLGLFLGAAVFFAAPPIAHHWVHAKTLPAATVQTSIVLMGATLALQWPFSFYEGGLIGLQRFGMYNAVQTILQIVRAVGAVVVLRFFSPTIGAFFVWQLSIGAVGTVAAAALLWHFMPRGSRPRYSRTAFAGVRRFAAEITLSGSLALALTQMDKLILSRRLGLDDFGYYNLAVVAASGLNYLVYPIATALYPRLSQYFALGDEVSLARAYHAACQLIAVIIAPVALVIAFFPSQVMMIWTRNAVAAQHTSVLVTLLVTAAMLNAFVTIPYVLQLAAGWPRLSLYTNMAMLCVQVPLLFFLTARYGAIGAASALLILNAVYVLGTVNFMYTRLLRGDRWRWYLHDLLLPCAAAAAVVVPMRLLLPPLSSAVMLPVLGGIAGLAFCAAAMAAPDSRRVLLDIATSVQRRLTA